MSAISIDLGTLYCKASWINPATGCAEAIEFQDMSASKLPSLLLLSDSGEPCVGYAPYYLLEHLSGNTDEQRIRLLQHIVQDIKRTMRPEGRYRMKDREYTHVEILSEILKKIKSEAGQYHQMTYDVDEAVLTYPLWFGEWQKDMYRKAAEWAGFKKSILLGEPLAATLHFLYDNQIKNARGVVVCDFGAGGFSATYVLVDSHGGENEYHVAIPPRHDNTCGGNDLDILLYREWERIARRQYNRNIAVHENEMDISFLLRCRKQKELLSQMRQFTFSELLPFSEEGCIQRLELPMDRESFNSVVSPIIERMVFLTEELLREVRADALPLDYLLLTGGGSRIPLVRERFQQIFGNIKIHLSGKADVAVALGGICYWKTPEPLIEKPNKPQPAPVVVKDKGKACNCYYCKSKITTKDKFCQICGRPNIYFKE